MKGKPFRLVFRYNSRRKKKIRKNLHAKTISSIFFISLSLRLIKEWRDMMCLCVSWERGTISLVIGVKSSEQGDLLNNLSSSLEFLVLMIFAISSRWPTCSWRGTREVSCLAAADLSSILLLLQQPVPGPPRDTILGLPAFPAQSPDREFNQRDFLVDGRPRVRARHMSMWDHDSIHPEEFGDKTQRLHSRIQLNLEGYRDALPNHYQERMLHKADYLIEEVQCRLLIWSCSDDFVTAFFELYQSYYTCTSQLRRSLLELAEDCVCGIGNREKGLYKANDGAQT